MNLTPDSSSELLPKPPTMMPRSLSHALVKLDKSVSIGQPSSPLPRIPTAVDPWTVWRLLCSSKPMLNFWASCSGLGFLFLAFSDLAMNSVLSRLSFLALMFFPLFSIFFALLEALAANESELSSLRQGLKEKTELAERLTSELQNSLSRFKEWKESKDSFLVL